MQEMFHLAFLVKIFAGGKEIIHAFNLHGEMVSSWVCPFGHERQNKQQQTEDPVFRHLRRARDKSRDKHTVI